MNHKIFFLVIIALIINLSNPHKGYTQQRTQYWKKDLTFFDYELAVLNPAKVIDTIDYTIYYWQKYRMDPQKSDLVHDRWGLDIGSRYSRFYSVTSFRNDLNNTKRNHANSGINAMLELLDAELLQVPQLTEPIMTVFPYEIQCDYQKKTLDFTDRIPMPQNGFICYEEDVPQVNWIIHHDESLVVGGFTCYHATAKFRGRKWSAWFAPDIPYNICVWKLNGLPGLILKLEDTTGDYSLEMIQIVKKHLPFWQFTQERKQMSFEKWQRLIKGFHNNASATLLGNECQLLRRDEIGNFQPVNEWVVPYNPIELE